MKKNYLTPSGLKRIQDEISYLLKTDRPKVTELVTWAASLGDRSENADYLYGKKRLREIDRRVRFLSKRLDDLEVVDPEKMSSDQVKFGATVSIIDERGVSRSYSIVGVDESDPKSGLISFKSPIGKALLSKEIGDEVNVQTPNGELYFEIVSIEYKAIIIAEFCVES